MKQICYSQNTFLPRKSAYLLSAAAATGGFAAADYVASAEFSAAALENISAAAALGGFTAAQSVVRSPPHPVKDVTPKSEKRRFLLLSEDFLLHIIASVSLAIVFVLVVSLKRSV